MKILIITASLRKESLNLKLGQLAARNLKELGVEVDFRTINEFDTISYNFDMEKEKGFPTETLNLQKAIMSNDAFIIVSPEYNGSIPGSLKNVIDWISRLKPNPLGGKSGYLMSASPSLVGGNLGLWSLRIPLEKLGSHLYPGMFSLASAQEAFDENGNLKRDDLALRLKSELKSFIEKIN